MGLADWLKAQGFHGVTQVARAMGVTRYTLHNWYNSEQKLNDVLKPRLELLKNKKAA